jgi:hypothetical protein
MAKKERLGADMNKTKTVSLPRQLAVFASNSEATRGTTMSNRVDEMICSADLADRTTLLVLADTLAEAGRDEESLAYRLAGTQRWSSEDNAVETLFGLPEGTISRHRRAHPDASMPGPDGTIPAPAHAAKVVAWTRAQWHALTKAATAIRREQAWEAAAAAGDVGALLGHPGARECLGRLLHGQKALPSWPGKKTTISDYTRSRKAVATAKALLAGREVRRDDRTVAERARAGEPGRFAAQWIEKLEGVAVAFGEHYHRHVARLYRSSRACVAYGHGGQEDLDRDAYSRSYRVATRGGDSFRPAAYWLNAGVRLDSEHQPTCVILENYLGREVCRVSLAEARRRMLERKEEVK